MPEVAAKVNVLVACAACRRQYDASELPLGALFHCYCGELVKVPAVTAQDAAVVRCSACGAPRRHAADSCDHCQADFTSHERDMHTACPECMTRISDRARFCHHCGTRIGARTPAGQPTDHACPACPTHPERPRLNHRQLGHAELPVLECPSCAGLWLTHEAVERVIERSRTTTPTADGLGTGGPDARPQVPRQSGPLYRRCPLCEKLMSRVNHGRRSGVIIDRCHEHGAWFDEQELGAVVAWVRGGGEQRAERSRRDEVRAAAARERFKPRIAGGQLSDGRESDDTPDWVAFLGRLLS